MKIGFIEGFIQGVRPLLNKKFADSAMEARLGLMRTSTAFSKLVNTGIVTAIWHGGNEGFDQRFFHGY